ncbi:hypothetical protein [Candidatus Poriferisocius sp.]|uniref:hypothetical protein n=1 Tax=Candidatus Poriferisocius sp. TaxID=3101276 RepID=UPI003B01EF61
MIIDATRAFGHRTTSAPPSLWPPAEAPSTLLWHVMARLDQCDRHRQLTKRCLAATTLAAASVVISRRMRR